MIKRIRVWLFLRKLGINHAWRASGDRNFIKY
jgi:hypothetical protein